MRPPLSRPGSRRRCSANSPVIQPAVLADEEQDGIGHIVGRPTRRSGKRLGAALSTSSRDRTEAQLDLLLDDDGAHAGLGDRARTDGVDADTVGRDLTATAWVSPTTPNFDAQYAPSSANPVLPASDAMLTTRPRPDAFRCGIASRITRNVPRRLMSRMRSHSAVVIPSSARNWKTRPSSPACPRPPSRSTVRRTPATTEPSSVTSIEIRVKRDATPDPSRPGHAGGPRSRPVRRCPAAAQRSRGPARLRRRHEGSSIGREAERGSAMAVRS